MSTDRSLGIDLGRHRAYAVSGDGEVTTVLPMQADHNGLVFRWLAPTGVERVLDCLQSLPPSQAMHVANQTCGMVADRIKAIDPKLLNNRVRVAVPVNVCPSAHRHLVAGFKNSDVAPTHNDLVERPIATLASWLRERRANGQETEQPILVLDNDAGQISAVVADPSQQRLLAIAELTPGPSENTGQVLHSLQSLLARASHVSANFGVNPLQDPQKLNPSPENIVINKVLLSGTTIDHPAIDHLLDETAPEAKVWGRNRSDSEMVVSFGLLHTDELAGWTCPWPTGYVVVDNKVALEPGTIPLLSTNTPTRKLASTSVDSSRVLRLTDAEGQPSPIMVSGEKGIGLRIPSSLGSSIKIHPGSDGRLTILGETDAEPLAIQPYWPVSGTSTNAVSVKILI